MAEKGSKYARKHTRQVDDNNEFEKENYTDSFFSVIYDDITFIQTFKNLPLTEQIKAYRTLKKLSETKNSGKLSASDRILAKNSEYKLKKINIASGLKLEDKTHYALSPDELHIIRMDCYGTVDPRPMHQLSRYYRYFLQNRLDKRLPEEFYDLNKAPAWQLFRQFRNFREIEKDIIRYMSQEYLDPKAITLMEVKDFSDIIFKCFENKSKYGKVFFLSKDSPRNAFVKKVAKQYEHQIFRFLKDQHIEERYIKSLISAMKTYGTTDSDRIIITESVFTANIIADLEASGISCRGYQIGDSIPQSLIAKLMAEDKGYLVAARDEKGNLIRGTKYPSFEVHHKTAVIESNNLAFIAMVNYDDNYLLVPSELHSHVLHGFDRLSSSAHKQTYHRRLEFTNSNITLMFGFNKETQIYHDWSKSKIYQKRMREDAEYIVSYDEVMSILSANRQKYLEQAQGFDFDIDNVVQIIRHKKRVDSEELLRKGRKIKKAENKLQIDNIDAFDAIIQKHKMKSRRGKV